MKNEIINKLKEFEESYGGIFERDTWVDIEVSDKNNYGIGLFCFIQEIDVNTGIYEVAVYKNYIDENGVLTSDWAKTIIPIIKDSLFGINKDFEEVLL